MSSRVTNISDLVQRVTGSCLLHPLGSARHGCTMAESVSGGEDSEEHYDSQGEVEGEHLQEAEEDEEEKKRREAESWERSKREMRSERLVVEMDALMSEVFDAVSGVKRAYVALQDAHNPWDPERMRAADVSLVGQLRRLGVLRERYRKSVTCQGGGGGGFGGVGLGVREVVAPYEAVAEELRREVKAREAEVENLKERLRCLMGGSDSGGKKGRRLSNRKLGFGAGQGNAMLSSSSACSVATLES